MSFALTTEQFRARTKTVTRRRGWHHAKAGDRYRGVEKARGRKPGEPIIELGVIEVVSARRELLNAITEAEVTREGFPGKSPDWFVEMFCAANSCHPDEEITRIEYRYVDDLSFRTAEVRR